METNWHENERGSTQDVMEFFLQFEEESERSPTVREIQKALGYRSTAGVFHHLVKLVEDGLLERVRNEDGNTIARGYRSTHLSTTPIEQVVIPKSLHQEIERIAGFPTDILRMDHLYHLAEEARKCGFGKRLDSHQTPPRMRSA